MNAEGDLRTHRAILEMDRSDLEDKHLRTLEENLVNSYSDLILVSHIRFSDQDLKKYARSQEDKMKRMATKLLRLTADDRKEARKDVHSLTSQLY